MSRVCIVGAGAWGRALAEVAAAGGHEVVLVARRRENVDQINTQRICRAVVNRPELPPGTSAVDIIEDVGAIDVLVLAVPAQASRQVIRGLPLFVRQEIPVVVTAKGFERKSGALQSEIVSQEWPEGLPVVLSGPGFATDVVAKKPTAVTLASQDHEVLERVAAIFSGVFFRPYLGNDPVGVQICGGLKNVYALGSGAIEGAKLGLSARAAFVTRATVEMGRMVREMGGKQTSVNGLAGMGDLILSCNSEQSRNFRFGLELGRGVCPNEARKRFKFLAEGVASTPVAQMMAEKARVDAPLIHATARLLSGQTDIDSIVRELMARPIRREEM